MKQLNPIVTAVIKSTGEIIEIPAGSTEEVSHSYELVRDTIIAYREVERGLIERGMQLLKETTHDR